MHTIKHSIVDDPLAAQIAADAVAASRVPIEELSIVVIHDEPFFSIVKEGNQFVGELFGREIALLELKKTAATYNLVVCDSWLIGEGHATVTFCEAGECSIR